MKNILHKIQSLYPLSDATIEELKAYVTPCRFPKRYQMIKADMFCKYAYFIEKGMTRSFWLVDGEEKCQARFVISCTKFLTLSPEEKPCSYEAFLPLTHF